MPAYDYDLERRTYEQHREELLRTAKGKFVLIHGDVMVGTYDEEADAIDEGYRQFGYVALYIKQILEVEEFIEFSRFSFSMIGL